MRRAGNHDGDASSQSYSAFCSSHCRPSLCLSPQHYATLGEVTDPSRKKRLMMKTESDRHHLDIFVQQVFGDQFAAVVLAGYGKEPTLLKTPLRIDLPSGSGTQTGRVIGLIGEPPCGSEPLVLAALLKLLLARRPTSEELVFGVGDVLDELGWPDTRGARDLIPRVIRKYVGLTYEMSREGNAGSMSGMYTLVTGYDRLAENSLGVGGLKRRVHLIHFHPGFVEGLNESKVIFAGVAFGELGSWGNR
jgi:hypothetical protein